ncbi:MAG: glycosyltransferase family 39 protein [Candidatus Altiarchaeota archaeon]|nr:glycosyltransferase family 39 protein [Candidatus Altiarchaeota archaeon]
MGSSSLNNRQTFCMLSCILLLAGFFRLYKLGEIPPGLFYDEAFFGNLGYCLLTTGKDLNGALLPLVSYSHLAFVLPLQMYPVAGSVFLFGPNEFAVRIIPAAVGILIVLSTFFLARLLFNNNIIGLISSLLVAVSPWHIVYSRIGFVHTFQPTLFLMLSMCLFLKGLQGSPRYLVYSGFAAGMGFFSYFLAHLFVPFFIFGFHYLVYSRVKKLNYTKHYRLFISAIIMMFLLSLLITKISGIDLERIPGPPTSESISDLARNIRGLAYTIFIPSGNLEMLPQSNVSYTYYYVYIPLSLAGILLLLKDRRMESTLILYWLILSLVLSALVSDTSHGALRRFYTSAGPVLDIIAAYGIYRILLYYRSRRKILLFLSALITISLALGACQFYASYFIYQPYLIETETAFMTPAKDVFAYTESVKDRYDKIVFTKDFALKNDVLISPEKVYTTSDLAIEDYQLFYAKRCAYDAKYVLDNVSSYPMDGKTLLVARSYELANATPLMVFYHRNGEVAYKIIA